MLGWLYQIKYLVWLYFCHLSNTSPNHPVNFTEAITLCDIISIYIYIYIIHNNSKTNKLRATNKWFLATCFGRIAAIFRPTYTNQVPSMYVQYGIP